MLIDFRQDLGSGSFGLFAKAFRFEGEMEPEYEEHVDEADDEVENDGL